MKTTEKFNQKLPDDLKECIDFHGHLCPGLVYGYLVAREAMQRLDLKRSFDEEVVAVCENDSCAVDALQILLGTSAGKGNLIIKDYGKNAYTVYNRKTRNAYRFSRTKPYVFKGENKKEFERLDAAVSAGDAEERDIWRLKLIKSIDLLSQACDDVFSISKVDFDMPPFAPLARSEACAGCGEMTMSTKMVEADGDRKFCVPCSEKGRS